MKYFPILDVFDIYRGSGKYTKKYVQEHTGNYPLFSGNTFGEFAKIDTFDYDSPALSWAIDGLAGYIMIHNAPFSATNHRGVLIPKIDNIDLEYIRYTIEPIFRDSKKGRQGENGENEYISLPPFMIQTLNIPIPVDENGVPDISVQREYSKRHTSLRFVKDQVFEQKELLENAYMMLMSLL